jgi:hypothetical protein
VGYDFGSGFGDWVRGADAGYVEEVDGSEAAVAVAGDADDAEAGSVGIDGPDAPPGADEVEPRAGCSGSGSGGKCTA